MNYCFTGVVVIDIMTIQGRAEGCVVGENWALAEFVWRRTGEAFA
jgi:hypothetical protein